MAKTRFLFLILMLFVNLSLFSVPTFLVIRETVEKGDTTETCKLVLRENPAYTVGFIRTPIEQRWLIQLYKDGGDGIISPLDSLGNPTGDDIMVTDSTHFKVSQGLSLPIAGVWPMSALKFEEPGSGGQVWHGDRIYIRIFNNASIDKADKYIVAHTLLKIMPANEVLEYVPDYAWDKQGWITFRK